MIAGEVPSGELGEICLRSPMAIQGYYRNPGATEEFFRGGWCHTGDIGFLDNSYMHVTGRKKNMIKSGGISIYPEEIEEVLLAIRLGGRGCRIVARCQLGRVGELRRAQSWEHHRDRCNNPLLQKRLANYKAPKCVEIVGSVPRTALGKIDRGKLAHGRPKFEAR